MRPLGVAHLTALELAPDDFIRAARRAGFTSVGLRVHPAMSGGVSFPTRVGTRHHEERRAILKGEGVALHDIEFIQLTPEVDVVAFAPMLEAGADLGAACVTVSGDDPDPARLAASFSALCDLAAHFGLRVDVEFMRWRIVGDLPSALSLLGAADRPNASVLLDALHLDRSGGRPEDVRRTPVGAIRAAQLCDAPAARPIDDAAAVAEARSGRLPPGRGSLPLRELVQALPVDTALGVEMPFPAMDPFSRLQLAFDSTVEVLGPR